MRVQHVIHLAIDSCVLHTWQGDSYMPVAGYAPSSGEPSALLSFLRQNVGTIGILVDVLENDNELLVVMDVPGVKQGDVHLKYEGDNLYLEASRDEGTHVFRRTFALSERIDAEHIQAELTHGVLTVHLPKAAQARAREIPVRVG